MSQTSVVVKIDSRIGTISPRLYGHFAEHLARCCYDGLWVGTDESAIPQDGGFRTDVLAALRALPVPLLRWPGGCYADHYHWRDGIGPRDQRPRRLGMSCGLQVEDDNGLGTHEFLRLCAELGAEPYLAGNVGTGSAQELCDWLEYCNSARDTALTRQRRTNGASNPFGVRLWGVVAIRWQEESFLFGLWALLKYWCRKGVVGAAPTPCELSRVRSLKSFQLTLSDGCFHAH